MKNISRKKMFVVAATIILTALLVIISNRYYNIQSVKTGLFANKTIYIGLMGVLSLALGWMLAFSLGEIKKTIKFLKLSVDNKKLIKSLSKNDFRNKFASSYLGIVWGFIHPLVTIAVYWFVFQVAFQQNSPQNPVNAPYIVWFICGIIPWFFFSESFPSTSNVFLEYSYLVKKVVFKIEVLPAVKIISSLFVHVFFILFIYVISAIYGIIPDLHTLQFIYYSASLIILVYSLSIFTSSVILFFRDLGQIINVILSVGFWFTPIGWGLERLDKYPAGLALIFKLNPLYYIVTGYRDAFVDKVFFWERPFETLYFWCFCFVILSIGIKIFNKLKPHFSDVI